LPVLGDKPSRAELNEKLTQVIEQLRVQAEASRELSRRAKEILPRASADGQAKLHQGLESYTAQARLASEQRDAWIQQVREKVKGMPKEKPGSD
jgi:glutamate synthase domain-containing protein 3